VKVRSAGTWSRTSSPPAAALLRPGQAFQPRLPRPPDATRLRPGDRIRRARRGHRRPARRRPPARRFQLRERRICRPGTLRPQGPRHRVEAHGADHPLWEEREAEMHRRPGAAGNTTMLEMCRQLGFEIADDPNDRTMKLVRLQLQLRLVADAPHRCTASLVETIVLDYLQGPRP
jgi:hypothetical protein